jgi:hypothetical protein
MAGRIGLPANFEWIEKWRGLFKQAAPFFLGRRKDRRQDPGIILDFAKSPVIDAPLFFMPRRE